MPSPALISGYRFNDLKRSRIVSSRSDLHEKQKTLGFPKPVKTGARSAWWPSEEIAAWVQTRIALRDNPDNNPDNSNDERAARSLPPARRKSRAITARKPSKQRPGLSVAEALAKMKAGELLKFEFGKSRPAWSLCGEAIAPETVSLLLATKEVEPDPDTLRDNVPAQVWRMRKA